jgi:hypothetical protein
MEQRGSIDYYQKLPIWSTNDRVFPRVNRARSMAMPLYPKCVFDRDSDGRGEVRSHGLAPSLLSSRLKGHNAQSKSAAYTLRGIGCEGSNL